MSEQPLIIINHRVVSDGGTLAKDIRAGQRVRTISGSYPVKVVEPFTNEGTPMIRLEYFAGAGQSIMPETCEVDVH